MSRKRLTVRKTPASSWVVMKGCLTQGTTPNTVGYLQRVLQTAKVLKAILPYLKDAALSQKEFLLDADARKAIASIDFFDAIQAME